MWIVRLALRRPFTIAVSAILIFMMGFFALDSMLVDIFPVIDIPVVSVIWNYPGLTATDMERRVVILSERAYSTTVNGISKIESKSITGIGLLRIYFQPGSDIGSAVAQIAAVSSTALRSMPPGMQPPVVFPFNASNVPVAQMTIFSDSIPEEKIFDYALNFIRIKLFTIPGLSTPAPYGGKTRQINIDVNPSALSGKGLSPNDVVDALQASNIILPAGTSRIGNFEYNVVLNSSPERVEQFSDIPIKVVNGATVTIGDVAKVSDSFVDQTNLVRVNGKRATYLNILKKADASTLTIIDSVKKILPEIQKMAPKGMNLRLDFDQSIFVQSSINSVLREAVVSSVLVSMMILLFLGSWRSVIVVCTSIPLAIFAAIIGLKLTGNSINIMTLGGLSLAIGMLVDDATVEVENIHRNRNLGLPLTKAILTGASQIALPAIMATLAICIVFFPVILLQGPARFLFIPMALSVVFSMLASYVLSRTLVPLLSRMLMKDEKHGAHALDMFPWFTRFFESLQKKYTEILRLFLANRSFVLWVCLGLFGITMVIPFVVGRDFFPATDTGLMKLHFRAPSGTRIEETEKLVAQVEDKIREIIPAKELITINSMVDVPISYNLGFVPTDNVASMDAEISIALGEGHHPTVGYMKKIRESINQLFPGATAYFQPADIVNQVLNFGVSAPIDIQFEYSDVQKSYDVAQELIPQLKEIPGLVDLAIPQVFDYPTLNLDVDRVRASQLGITQRDVANNMLVSLSSSSLVYPSYFLNPKNNVNYIVAVKVPLEQLTSVNDLLSTTITPDSQNRLLQNTGVVNLAEIPGATAQRLGNLINMRTTNTLDNISHVNVQRTLDILGGAEGRDLGSVLSAIQKRMSQLKIPDGMAIHIRGQGEVMNEAFHRLGLGLIVSIILVYLLMVVLFQTWIDPFIVVVAVPGALTGILWTLLITGTTINVVSFMGSIMAVGIAASNSILLVSFANDLRVEKGVDALEAALEAGKTRIRPVLMTALAMILGMLPTALALGEGGEQNAPLGRVVIGGLLVATVVTLFIVPIVYSLLRVAVPTRHLLDERIEKEEAEPNEGLITT